MIDRFTMRVYLANPAGAIVTSHGVRRENVESFCERIRQGVLSAVIAVGADGISATVVPIGNVLKIEFRPDTSDHPLREPQP